ncbi:5-carboxymethyl-2-hydroxymuconate isomerase [Agromyces badenianii]|uniref:5-carboxymethyl-2-hydroxymuconate isomerase n=1 Tax=Agromyces badenianii TaxID=2080742 RepID=A0A2S0WTY4_9MICO|nr:fumarylacetoacetate hydrolase family protein [Agromyces badenianii]AWB94805.1 5-carboxymethyl-2-hydroxymuconate isomerase [Agromyces badenianii]PWC03398.1 fumarylacetoacetate hydrolase family protein [Agromyces badenianii]
MRIGRARHDGVVRTFAVTEDGYVLLPLGAPTPDDLVRLPAVRTALDEAIAAGVPVDSDDLEILSPITRFNRDILCTGWNYWDHFEESKGKREGQDPADRPLHPTFFTKGPGTVLGPVDPVPWDPELSEKWDYEVELALVIGTDGRSIPEDRALDHIAGLLVANDVSQRDLQRAHGGQWLKGKSIDGSLPLGPWLTTVDEVDLDAGLELEFSLNGERLQAASTSQMAFSIPRIISELSRGMTLRAGDVILTGTPSGIGNAREPQIFLKDGDVLVSSVSGLGALRNVITRASLTEYVTGGVQ